MNTDFDAAAALPSQIPIFPLPNALLLPGGQLPLNIFEPRYLAMIEDALGASGRLIGMVQPIEEEGELFGIGCAGRISYFQETGDGRYMIALNGVSRFRLHDHKLTSRGYRLADVGWGNSSPTSRMAKAESATGTICFWSCVAISTSAGSRRTGTRSNGLTTTPF